MPAFDYARSRATADRLIAKFGQTGAVRRPTATGPDYNPTITTADHTATFAVMEYESNEIDGSRILATDKKVLLKAGSLAVTPNTTDKLVIGGIEHSIVRVEPLAPGGTVVMWTLQCRR